MRKLFNFRRTLSFSVFALLVVLIFGATDSAFAQTRKKTYKKRPVLKKTTVKKTVPAVPKTVLYNVEADTRLRVRINETLNSKTAKVGDLFTTTVTEQVRSTEGVLVIPQGSTVLGKIVSVKPAAKGGKPGEIDVAFYGVKMPNGVTHTINGTLTDLDSKDAKSDPEGTAKGGQMKNRKLIFYGGGAGGGAVLGGLVGGGKGALIGGIIGGVAGAITENQTKGGDAEVKSGMEFGVLLNQAVSLPKFVEPTN